MFLIVLGMISLTGSVSLRSSSPPIFQISPSSSNFRAAFGRELGVLGKPNSVAVNLDAVVNDYLGESKGMFLIVLGTT